MPEASSGEKTLPASPMKRQRAREEGRVAKSQDLSAAWTLLLALLAFVVFGRYAMGQLVDTTRYFFSEMLLTSTHQDQMQQTVLQVVYHIGRIVLPLMLFLTLGGVSMNVFQVGFLMSPKPLQPKLSKINPFTGFQKFFSLRSLVELIKSILKITLIVAIVYFTMKTRWDRLFTLMFMPPQELVFAVGGLVYSVWWRVGVAMLVLGLFDYGFQYWQHEKDLMMTYQEAKEETRQMEGDPQIKQRVRQLQRQMAMQRMMREVPEAEVVITNPIRYAVALRYDPSEMDAPIVVAKGARLVAARIREIAAENNVPIVEKPELARTLFRSVEVGHPVPEKLFRAVAEILAFVFQIDRRAAKLAERSRMNQTAQSA